MQTDSLNQTFESLDAFLAAHEPGFKKGSAASDPLERYHVIGDFWTGRIKKQADGQCIPEVEPIDSIFGAKQAAKKGWLPLFDASGAIAVPDVIVALFRKFKFVGPSGKPGEPGEPPARIAALLKADDARKAPKVEPAKK